MLEKSIVMIVNEMKCIFMHINFMNAWLFKHFCTCGEQGWKIHGKKAFCVVLIDRGDSYRGAVNGRREWAIWYVQEMSNFLKLSSIISLC